MKFLISGGSGFLGRALTKALLAHQHHITWVSHRPEAIQNDRITVLSYSELTAIKQHFDYVINLAGAGIADKRWSEKRKTLLLNSRILPTQALLSFMQQYPPKHFFSGSAIGWYGSPPKQNQPLTEDSGFHFDFPHQLCETWETQALKAQEYGINTTILRTGVVLSTHGGMLNKLMPTFKLGLGAYLGSGKQMMSWISLRDWVEAVLFLINKAENNQAPLIVNLTAPQAINNREFTRALAHHLHRPVFLKLPTSLLKLLFGEMATLLIDGQNVKPQALLDHGYCFQDTFIHQAFESS